MNAWGYIILKKLILDVAISVQIFALRLQIYQWTKFNDMAWVMLKTNKNRVKNYQITQFCLSGDNL